MNRLRSGAIITIPSAVEASATQARRKPRARCACRQPTGAVTAIASPLPHRWRTKSGRARRRRAHRHGGGGTNAGARASGQRSVAGVEGRWRGTGAGAAETTVARERAVARGARPHRRAREIAEGHAARRSSCSNQTLAQAADAGGRRQGQGAPPAPRRRSPTAPRRRRPRAVGDVRRRSRWRNRSSGVGPRPPNRQGARTSRRGRRRPPSRPGRRAAEGARCRPAGRTAEGSGAAEGRRRSGRGAAEGRRAAQGGGAAEGRRAKAPAKAAAKEPPGFFDDLMASTPAWAIGAGALALLAGIVALFAARRRKTTKFEDSIISGTDIKTNTVFGSTGGGVVNTGDNSLASDFSREGLGNIDTDEVDPIAEAEVYLAYGRDAQAEEILKDALKKDPQRQEIYLKLLEIHAQHNKPSAFETVASELYAVSQRPGRGLAEGGRARTPARPDQSDVRRRLGPPPAGRDGAGGVCRGRRHRARAHRASARCRASSSRWTRRSRSRPTSVRGRSRRPISWPAPSPSSRRPRDFASDFDPDRRQRDRRPHGAFGPQAPRLRRRPRRPRRRRVVHPRCTDKVESAQGQRRRGASSTSTSSSTTTRSRRRWPSRAPSPCSRPRRIADAGHRQRARAADAARRRDRARQARPVLRSRARDVRGSDAVGARRPVARRRHQARPRQGVPGDGRRRRRARDPAGSAARRRRPAEGRSEVAARASSG